MTVRVTQWEYARLEYRSTGIRPAGEGYVVDGELTLHGVTRRVPLALEVNGFQAVTPFGDTRVGFSASTEINREDWGLSWNQVLESGGFVVGKKIRIDINVEVASKA